MGGLDSYGILYVAGHQYNQSGFDYAFDPIANMKVLILLGIINLLKFLNKRLIIIKLIINQVVM